MFQLRRKFIQTKHGRAEQKADQVSCVIPSVFKPCMLSLNLQPLKALGFRMGLGSRAGLGLRV